MSISRNELVTWLNDYLKIDAFRDTSLNGLQLEGRETVTRIAVAVDSTLATLEEAAQSGADFLIVHHGWFWGKPLAITGAHGKRVRTALEARFSLYAAHLPLDAHMEVGNNVSMANALSLKDIKPFGEYKGTSIGVQGRLPVPLSLQDLADQIQNITGEICLVHGGGPGMISSIGICSGEGSNIRCQRHLLRTLRIRNPGSPGFGGQTRGHVRTAVAVFAPTNRTVRTQIKVTEA
jgi:putative NIF3 family GTP cyclohydrolase 1 type 2